MQGNQLGLNYISRTALAAVFISRTALAAVFSRVVFSKEPGLTPMRLMSRRLTPAPSLAYCRPRRSPRGVILLVVLGMLTLFSVLAVSYLVFTARNRVASYNIAQAEISKIDSEKLVKDALKGILVGSNGPTSSLWGHAILADLYGMRDGVTGQVTPATNVGADLDTAPEILLGDQFLRFPTTLHVSAEYPFRRNDNEVDRRYPVYTGTYTNGPTTTSFPIDDSLNGRLLTFTDGPLAGLTMPIVRYFGDHRSSSNAMGQLNGQVIVDIRDHLDARIEIDGDTLTLSQWLSLATFSPHRLIYDNTITGLPTPAQPYSDFYINGQILNGPGLGWDLARSNFNTATGTEFNLDDVVATTLNVASLAVAIRDSTALTGAHVPITGTAFASSGADVPIALQGHYALHRFAPEDNPTIALESFLQDLPPGDVDEPYDAADYNNLWLSYFPNDSDLGEPTPSFVRPALLNWIINQEGQTLQSLSVARLRGILFALQRCTLRPLPYANDPNVPANIADRGEGVLKLRYANASAASPILFTGSNETAGLNSPTDIASNDPNYLAGRIRLIARALAGLDTNADGAIDSWDVDNNNDGVVDSIWIDGGGELIQSPDGKLLKPMVSYMVEDLGGRVNVNLAGNLAQAKDVITTSMAGSLQHLNPDLTPARTPATAPAPVPTGLPSPAFRELSVPDMPTGFGYGPAEIDLRALFSSNGTTGSTAQNLLRGPRRLLGERLNVWSNVDGKLSPMAPLAAGVNIAPGELYDPLTGSGNDILGALRYPSRMNLHQFANPQGLPVDAFGRASVGLGVDGGLLVSGGTFPVRYGGVIAGDSFDDPYEFDRHASGEPDSPFTLADMEGLLRFNDFDRDLLSSRLVDLINDYHDDINGTQPNVLQQLRQLLADSFTTHSNSAAIPTGTLPSEWRTRPNLDTPASLSPTRQQTATGALPPQTLFRLGFAAAEPRRANYPAGATGDSLYQTGLRNYYTAVNGVLWELLPFESRSGKRMNLNRPFGNGVDDDGDGVIDDPGEVTLDYNNRVDDDVDGTVDEPDEKSYIDRPLRLPGSLTRWTSSRGDATPLEPGFVATYDDASLVDSRQLFARHLYVLAMFLMRDNSALTPVDFSFPDDPGGTVAQPTVRRDPSNPGTYVPVSRADEYRAWKVAQWAVNVADYRDTDAIMTRFVYDTYPYDGWDILRTPGGQNTFREVWGLENPELTLEESLAFHDRCVRDTDLDDGVGAKRLNGSDGSASLGSDPDPDQWKMPVGSAFFEVRSTRSPQPLRVPPLPWDDTTETNTGVNAWSYPPELYTNIGTPAAPNWVLDLGRQAPDRNPVWRIAITNAHPNAATNATEAELCPDFSLQPYGAVLDPTNPSGPAPTAPISTNYNRETATIEPRQPNFFGPTKLSQTVIDRVVWFASEDPDPNDDGRVEPWLPPDSSAPGKIYYNRSGNRYLQNGQYAVVGPRLTTPVGTLKANATLGGPTHDPLTDEVLADPVDYPSKQIISLAGTVEHQDVDGNSTRPPLSNAADGSIRNPMPIIAASNPPTAWNGPDTSNRVIGLNVSEPYEVVDPALTARSYYREPTHRLNDRQVGTANEFPIDTWYNTETGMGPGFPDRPFDSESYAELQRPLGTDLRHTGTYLHYKTAYLQRLADPTRPFHATLNPYITVDYIAIDLTVFNGSMDNSASLRDNMMNPLWPDGDDEFPFTTAPDERFGSRYKTGQPLHKKVTDLPLSNLTHSVNTLPPALTPKPPGPVGTANEPFFKIGLNVGVDANDVTSPPAPGTGPTVHSTTLGYLNHSFGRRWAQQTTGTEASIEPFIGLPFEPWRSNILWLNRDFVSAEELMWVPTSGPNRLGFEFGDAQGLSVNDKYDDSNNTQAGASAITDERRFNMNDQFTHLWNYFSSNANDFTTAPNFWRILEWVEVPPPFDSDVDFISPEADLFQAGEQSNFTPNFNYDTFGPPPPPPPVPPALPQLPSVDGNPNNWTFAGQTDRIWNVGTGRWGSTTPGGGRTNGFWTNYVSIEQFRPPNSFHSNLFRNGLVNLNTVKNANVYRALMFGFSTGAERTVAGAFSIPFVKDRRGYDPNNPPAKQPQHTRLRLSLNEAFPTQFPGVYQSPHGSDIAPPIAVLRKEPINATLLRPDLDTSTKPLYQRDSASVPAAQSHDRSVVHQQLGLSRLSNMTSGQSNVFAIWITVGLFEVDAETLTVGQEYGFDTGNVERYKGFFIIDRSKPVMFQPGEENNMGNVVEVARILN